MKHYIALMGVLSCGFMSVYSQINTVEQTSEIMILLSTVQDGEPDVITEKIKKSWIEYATAHSVDNIFMNIEVKNKSHIYISISAASPDVLLFNVKRFYKESFQNIVNERGVVWLDGPWLSTTTKINLRKLIHEEKELFIE